LFEAVADITVDATDDLRVVVSTIVQEPLSL
jgi:hypothetical protein